MKVFVIRDYSFYHDANIEIHGVFSSREKAQEYMKDNGLATQDENDEHWHEIEEYTLDNEK